MIKFSVRTFTPQQAAEISGVSQETQRDWRRRGFLKKKPGGGWTAYDHLDLAKLMTMKTLSETGIDLSKAQKIADAAAWMIVYGLGRRFLKSSEEVRNPSKVMTVSEAENCKRRLRQKGNAQYTDLEDVIRGPQGPMVFFGLYYLKIYKQNSGEIPPNGVFFYVIWNGSIGSPEFVLDISKWFTENPSSRAVIILDTRPVLNALTEKLSKLSNPLLTVIESNTERGAA